MPDTNRSKKLERIPADIPGFDEYEITSKGIVVRK